MPYTFDSVTGYVIADKNNTIRGQFTHFADAVRAVKEGDHIHMVCGRGNSHDHTPRCGHPGCDGLIPPFPEALCSECRSY